MITPILYHKEICPDGSVIIRTEDGGVAEIYKKDDGWETTLFWTRDIRKDIDWEELDEGKIAHKNWMTESKVINDEMILYCLEWLHAHPTPGKIASTFQEVSADLYPVEMQFIKEYARELAEKDFGGSATWTDSSKAYSEHFIKIKSLILDYLKPKKEKT